MNEMLLKKDNLSPKINYTIDANVFYCYYGREKLGLKLDTNILVNRLVNNLDLANVFLPYYAFVEILVHFREEPDKIKLILDFMKRKNIIVRFIDNFLRKYDVTKLCTFSDHDIKNIISTQQLEDKINKEAEFCMLFCYIVCTAQYIFSVGVNSIPDNIINTFKNSVSEFFKQKQNTIIENISSELKIGYAKNKQEKSLKDSFELNTAIMTTITNALILYIKQNLVQINESKINAFINNYYDIVQIEQMKWEKTYPTKLIAENLALIPNFLSNICKCSEDVFANSGFTEIQIKYVVYIIKKLLGNGAKFKKNDIFDMLILGSITEEYPLLLTFDNEMKEHLKLYSKQSFERINRFYKTIQ